MDKVPQYIDIECFDFDRGMRDDKIGVARIDIASLWTAAEQAIKLNPTPKPAQPAQPGEPEVQEEKLNEAGSNQLMQWFELTPKIGTPADPNDELGSVQIAVRCTIDSVINNQSTTAASLPTHLLVVELPQGPAPQVKCVKTIPPKSEPEVFVAWGNQKVSAPLFENKSRTCAFWVHAASQSGFQLQFGVTNKGTLAATGAIPAATLIPQAATAAQSQSDEVKEIAEDASGDLASPNPVEVEAETKSVSTDAAPAPVSWVALTTGDLIDKDRNLQDLDKSPLFFREVGAEPEASVVADALKNSAFAHEQVIVMLPINVKCYTIAEARVKLADSLMENYDTDGSNKISMSEFHEVLKGLTNYDVDPKITEEVFRAVLATRGTTPEAKTVSEASGPDMEDPELSREELPRVLDMVSFFSPEFARKMLLGMMRAILGKDSFMDGVSYENEDPLSRTSIRVLDRKTGLIVEENIPGYISASLRVMFANRVSRKLSSNALAEALMARLSRKQGEKFNKPESRNGIEDFIRLHRLNRDEIEKDVSEYETFNEFFARRLKPWARPIADPQDPCVAISAADCRLTVFPTIDLATKLWIKGDKFTVEGVLQDDAEAQRYHGGSMCIFRLAPQDYHRWHLPVGGRLREGPSIDGALYTVNPLAINKNVNVYTKNKRRVFYIDSEEFGTVALVAVGATCVGSIVITAEPGTYSKGQEHGYFAFGGSTVLAFFEPNKIVFDKDLWDNTEKGIETLVQANSRIGLASVALNRQKSVTANPEAKETTSVESKEVAPEAAESKEVVPEATPGAVETSDVSPDNAVQPAPAEPVPAEPASAEPASAEPAPAEPAPTSDASNNQEAPAGESAPDQGEPAAEAPAAAGAADAEVSAQ